MIHIDHAFNILKQNQGLYFAKDCQSVYYGASQFFVLLAGLDKCAKIEGKHDIDLPWANSTETLLLHDKYVVTQNTAWCGYESGKISSCSDKIYALISKMPMIGHNGAVIGVFGMMLAVSQKADFSLLTQLNQEKDNNKQNYSFVTPPILQSLTQRELICWFFITHGKSLKQIAQVMRISLRTVEFHLMNIKNKLNVKFKTDLIDHAFSYGLLQFIPPIIRNEYYIQLLQEEA